jgi:DNA-damage-inducible protein J
MRLPQVIRDRRFCFAGSASHLFGVMQTHYNHITPRKSMMAGSALVQTRIDAEIKARAAGVLAGVGLSVSDAVRILLTRTAEEGALPFALTAETPAYDAWFRAKVLAALEDPRPDVAADDVEAVFAARRAAAMAKARV